MKIFDCITYFNEPLLFNLRLNILNDYVDEFIVSEATYTHSGKKKKLNFNINDYPKFKKKITHIVVDKQPEDLIRLTKKNKFNNSLLRNNAIKRIAKQRDKIKSYFNSSNNDDWIIYSDSDEIPNLKNLTFKKINQKIIIFKQLFFHYKFNLFLKGEDWYGSKACKYKNLISISDLRNIKTKKYNFWRFDTIFSKNKYINLKIINNGGWHFSQLKKPSEIFTKFKNDEHHDEFKLTRINQNDIKNMVKYNYISYDHSADKTNIKKKFNKSNRIYLSQINDNKLPNYLILNKKKYLNWFKKY